MANLLDPILITVFTIASALYLCLGLPYAAIAMFMISAVGYSIVDLLGIVLILQVFLSIASSLIHRRSVDNPLKSVLQSVIVGLSAATAFLAALLLGLYIADSPRLLLNAFVLSLASLCLSRKTSGKRDPSPLTCIGIGVVIGFVKGSLGGSTAPLLIASNRLLGMSFDESMFRTMVTQAIICVAAAIPYIIHAHISLGQALSIAIGSVIGIALARIGIEKLSVFRRDAFCRYALFLLAIALYIEALHRYVGG